ncbi:MAG: hypothetical protein QN157_08960 [Armatimonadota bacterium]|nr:hypothetical protein [Armatimonadota bacterium]
MSQVLTLRSRSTTRKPTVYLSATQDPALREHEVLQALSRLRPPQVFVRGGRLVRVVATTHGAQLDELDEAALSGILQRSVTFVRVDRHRVTYAYPPRELVRMILRRGSWPLPDLVGIVRCPVVRPDGIIVLREGYDPATCLYYAAGDLDVPCPPDDPTPHDVDRARQLLLEELLGDFPFADDASRANALALLLSPLLRFAVAGSTPLFLVSKPTPGTGATLLARAAALIATGHDAVTNPPESEEEARKLITSVLLEGRQVVVLDDVGSLKLRALSHLVTTKRWSARLLGTNRVCELLQSATWIATGNNVQLGADLARRVVWIRLDAKHYRPWERSGFRHPDLLRWVREHRGELIWALLVLCRAWWAAGCPEAEVPTMGGFEAWARLVGSILHHAGIEGFLANRQQLYDLDQEHAGWFEFFVVLQERAPARGWRRPCARSCWSSKTCARYFGIIRTKWP